MCLNFFKKKPKDPIPIGGKLGLTKYHLEEYMDFRVIELDWDLWDWRYPGYQDQKGNVKWVKECIYQDSQGVHLVAKRGNGIDLCGQLTTHKFLKTLYGYISFTAKMPPKGLLYFPALWGYNGLGWQPEIDVVELAGGQSNQLWFTHHYVGQNGSDVAIGTNLKWESIDFSKDFHKYGILWEPNKMTWYVDELPYYQVTDNIPNVPIFWVMNIQAGYGPPFTHLFTEEESGQEMIIREFEIWKL